MIEKRRATRLARMGCSGARLGLLLAALAPAPVAEALETVPLPVPRQGGAPAPASREPGPVTGLPLPRFVSLRSNEINVRRGPGKAYRLDWVFRRKGLPVRIVAEFGDWRRVVDQEGATGWVHRALLTGRRTVVVTAETALLRREPAARARATAEVERGVVARLEGCRSDWCAVDAGGAEGWIERDAIWGVDADEP